MEILIYLVRDLALLGAAPLAVGFVLDLLFGDPHWLPHPVVGIGKLISLLEKWLRGAFAKTSKGELAAGAVMAALVPLISFAVPFGILWAARRVSLWLCFGLESFMCYQILATRALRDESMAVFKALAQGDLEKARYAVSRIVGRDTAALEETGVTKAAVETIAENSSDGVVAPMLFMLLGGAPLGFFYKGINTMDSMVGYKNDRYLYFGRAAAKLDDAANFLPSRIAALLMIAASWLCGLDAANAWRIYKRDRRNHASPNSAQTEAVCAGALRVQLAGDASYFGKLVHKPTIGDPLRPVEPHDIPRAARLLYWTAALCAVLCVAARFELLMLILIV